MRKRFAGLGTTKDDGSMRISYLREYIIAAQLLNIKAAAERACISPSSLSKHIKSLEEESHCHLIALSNGQMTLTEAGALFLDGANRIVESYDEAKRVCDNLYNIEKSSPRPYLLVQQHSLIDKGAEAYYRSISRLSSKCPHLQVRFTKGSRRDFVDELKHSNIDMCLIYRCGNVRKIIREYAEAGLLATYLHSEPIAAWCRWTDVPRRTIRPELLAELPIVLPADASAPMIGPAIDLCHEYGFEPTFVTVPSTNQPEYLNARPHNAVYLYPYSFTQSPLLRAHEDMHPATFATNDRVHSFSLVRKPETDWDRTITDALLAPVTNLSDYRYA